jgi:hypothetical protein
MPLFEFNQDQLDEYKVKLVDEVTPHCGGEEVVAVGLFRRGGASASYAASKAGGGLVYAAVGLARKKRAGGMPEKVILAVTPSRLYAFSYGHRRSGYSVKKEVAVWDRDDITCRTSRAGHMTALEITSPSEGERARLVGGSVKDDPWSREVIEALGATPAVA